MKRGLALISLLAIVSLVPACDRAPIPEPENASAPPSLAELLEVYDYDPDAPLPYRFEGDGVPAADRAVRFTFRNWERETVSGLVALPENGSAPYPTVVYFHRPAEDETAALAVRDALRDLSVAVIAVRLPAKRQAAMKGGEAREKRRESFRNRRLAVLEARSALDALVARGLADPARVAAVGAGAGGGPAIVFAAVEPRVRAVAALAAGADDLSRAIPDRAADIAENARRTVASVDPVVFAPLVAPRPLLVVRGESDSEVSPESARALLDAAREPKSLVTVPASGHEFEVALAARDLVLFLGPALASNR